jgi:hypothetical protein
MAITRDQLYLEVWAEPMTKVAARYGVSSSFLARVCRDMNVPSPGRGHWARVQHQKKPQQVPLPEARSGEILEWTRPGEEPSPVRLASSATPQPGSAAAPPTTQRQPRQPKEHPLVSDARKHFASATVSKLHYLRPNKMKTIDVLVSQATLERALDAANAIYRALERKHHRVMLAPWNGFSRAALDEREFTKDKNRRDERYYSNWKPDRPTITFLGEIPIALAIYESSESVKVVYVDGEYVKASLAPLERRSWSTYEHHEHLPSGRLCLRMVSAKNHDAWERVWREEHGRKLRSMATTIVEELEAETPKIAEKLAEARRLWEEQRKKWQAEQEKWEREQAERARIEDIKRSREQLASIIQKWSSAMSVQAFFADVERRADALPEEQRQSVLDRIAAGKQLVGSTDALGQLLIWRPPSS